MQAESEWTCTGDTVFEMTFKRVSQGAENVNFDQYVEYMVSISSDAASLPQLRDSFEAISSGKDFITEQDMRWITFPSNTHICHASSTTKKPFHLLRVYVLFLREVDLCDQNRVAQMPDGQISYLLSVLPPKAGISGGFDYKKWLEQQFNWATFILIWVLVLSIGPHTIHMSFCCYSLFWLLGSTPSSTQHKAECFNKLSTPLRNLLFTWITKNLLKKRSHQKRIQSSKKDCKRKSKFWAALGVFV